jgi:hypothetical protein
VVAAGDYKTGVGAENLIDCFSKLVSAAPIVLERLK